MVCAFFHTLSDPTGFILPCAATKTGGPVMLKYARIEYSYLTKVIRPPPY